MRRFLTVALIASALLTTSTFAANAKKSTHPKQHAKGAAHSQPQHVQHVAPTHGQSAHHSAAHKKSGKSHAHKPAGQQV